MAGSAEPAPEQEWTSSGWAEGSTCAWCDEPLDDESTEWVNPTPSEGGNITEVGHVGCAPADWPQA
jgi:hypothetical protein